jgi:hypothetical protein
LPPCPYFAFGSISFGSIEKGSVDTEHASCLVAEISLGSGPSFSMLDDEAMTAQSAEDPRGVPGTGPEDPRSSFYSESRVLAQDGVELSREVTEAGAGEQVVSTVCQFVLELGYLDGTGVEEVRRGAGVI